MDDEALEAIKRLQEGAKENHKTHLDIDIHAIVKKGDVERLKECLYLEPFCIHEKKIRSGETPLHVAVEYSRLDAVAFLLESGADVRACTTQGLTALHKASTNGDLVCAKMLIDACVKKEKQEAELEDNANVESGGGLLRRRKTKYIEEEKPIIELPEDHNVVCTLINMYDNDWLTPLHYACIAGVVDMVKYLLECGSLPAIQTKNSGDDSLMLACFYGNLAVVEYLLNFKGCITLGVNVLTRNNHGNTCLHRACVRGHYETARYLQKKGANLLVVNDNNETPIDLASPETIKYLTPVVDPNKNR